MEEWRVSELLPDKDLHERDEYWQAFVIGDNIPKVLKRLHIGTVRDTFGNGCDDARLQTA